MEGRIVHIFVRSDNFSETASIPEHVRQALRRYCVEDSGSPAPSGMPG